MMSFLKNILQRHQLEPASQLASYIVQPRPQSRFESDQGGLIEGHESHGEGLKRTATSETESRFFSAQRAPKHQPPLATGSVTPHRQPTVTQAAAIVGDMGPGGVQNESIEGRMDERTHSIDQIPFKYKPLEHTSAIQQPVQQKNNGDHSPPETIANSTPARQSFQRAPQSNERRGALSQEPVTQQKIQRQAEVKNDLNQNIEAVLEAVSRLKTHTASDQIPLGPRQHITSKNTDRNHFEADGFNQPVQTDLNRSNNQPVHADGQHSPVISGDNQLLPNTGGQTLTGLQGPAPVPEPTSGATEPPYQREQTGSLQIPDWMVGIQAELQNRWREIIPQEASEPVVNITIGRVEVRAIQDRPGKQSKASNRPSGVMTLDAYLKQRDRRGRA